MKEKGVARKTGVGELQKVLLHAFHLVHDSIFFFKLRAALCGKQ